MKTKKGKGMFSGKQKVQRSPEEMFMLSNMAPACHSKHIENNYYLNVNIKYNGCTCCCSLPNVSVPLTVIPDTHQASYGFTEPAGYQPYELGYFKFNLEFFQF
mmetsp:Transcript_226/g.413  ORF Transcript_226/g.413 Transcript_226/m.413 type:complete len:103 (+) Transcript_226:851-1159(+)